MNKSAFTFPDRVRYYLVHLESGKREYILEPRGWYEDEKSISRDKTYYGISRKTSDNLQFLDAKIYVNGEFIEGGYNFITDIRENVGVNETVVVVREERNNQTDVYEEDYRSELDLFSYVSESNDSGETYCSLKSSDAGLDATLKARKSESMEITRRFALDDSNEENELVEIETELVELRGRKIELLGRQESSVNSVTVNQYGSSFVKTDLKYSSDERFKIVTQDHNLSSPYPSGIMFYAGLGDAKSSSNFKVKWDTVVIPNRSSIGNERIRLILTAYSYDGTNYQFDSFYDIYGSISGIYFGNGVAISSSWFYEMNLPVDGAISIGFGKNGDNVSTALSLDISKWVISIEEQDEQTPTTTKAYRYKNAFDRYLELMTGRSGLFRSDFFDTIGKNFFLTDGALVRNIPVTSDNPNARTHQLETSFKDCFDSIDACWNLGLGIEREGLREYLRIEQKEYFFQPYVVVELGELRNVKESTASEFIYSGINIGYDGEAKIESIQGLDKTSGKVNRITKITGQEKVYSKVSKHQSDDYPRELQRRNQFVKTPTEDFKYDETKMILDCQNPVATISFTLVDNYLVNEGVILETPTAFSELLYFQFSDTPAPNTILIGWEKEDTLQNAYVYLTEVDFYKDYFDYTISGSTITGVCKVEWLWFDVYGENNDGSMTYDISNYGNDVNDRAYKQRTSLEDFYSLPEGIYDPEGLTNGRWTPLAMVLRHGSWIRAGLNNYKDSELSFGSSNSNTQLTGTLKNDNDYPYLKRIRYSESSNIKVSDLEENFFEPKWIEGNHVVTQEIMRKLEGYSEINGKKFKTFYGLFSFVINGETRTGFVFDVKPNGDGSWKFLSFRKR